MVEHLVTMCKAWSSSLVPGPTNQASIALWMHEASLEDVRYFCQVVGVNPIRGTHLCRGQ